MHKKLLHLCIFVELWCILLSLWHGSLHSRFLEVFFRLLDLSSHLVLFPLQRNDYFAAHKTNLLMLLISRSVQKAPKESFIFRSNMNFVNLEKSKDLGNFPIFFSVPFCFQQGALQVPNNRR